MDSGCGRPVDSMTQMCFVCPIRRFVREPSVDTADFLFTFLRGAAGTSEAEIAVEDDADTDQDPAHGQQKCFGIHVWYLSSS